ncbi:DUF229 domain-containing protein [Caenorhabditis elegans]|uniref:DUF229 domain-containing protein n=1 Tax=Caenorhabditis elegans TaxID=6239 RepID=O18062_CAEEL|nr:DUF229 domain-containing protein [Caenorhabditis elegans]CAB05275.2 DUF229 domain-containing protein [Caenorhabditis elegans]|eukprot:NP_501945.2 Uncharacterized protein CELE_T07G12.3 [Caenorhabditis elegans]
MKFIKYIITILLAFLGFYMLSWRSFNNGSTKIESKFLYLDSSRSAHNICALPIYDYWDTSIKNVMHEYNPARNCYKNYVQWTELVNSTWRIVKDGANCLARCFSGIGGSKNVKIGPWMKPGHVDCEFLETVCWEDNIEVYGHIHTQIIPRKASPTKFKDAPNVFIFTIDAMNTGMAKRSFPKLLSYFKNEFQMIEFPFVNKVGENSRPNGLPLWFGKSIEGGRRVTGDDVEVDWDWNQYCETYLDNSSHIFKDFKDHGYATMLFEDWEGNVVDSWPTCVGFEEPPTDHTFRPFASVSETHGMEITKRHLSGKFCRETHHAIMELLEQGIEAYKDRPIFSWLWLAWVAHDWIDGAARVDEYLVNYFKKHNNMFDNSFVMFVSDHGLRTGKHMRTEIGAFERDNPFLSISIPKRFRATKFGILETLNFDSKQLQTHFDVRATLLDILKFQPTSKFMDRQQKNIPDEKGHSLIRKQPDFPRTCATLPIPQQWCICQVDKFEIHNETLKNHLGEKLLNHVHRKLKKLNVSEICETFRLSKVTSLIEYGYVRTMRTYKISVETTISSYAHFETFVTYDIETDIAKFEKVTRLDNYAMTTDCTKPIRQSPLCYCKNINFPLRILLRMIL